MFLARAAHAYEKEFSEFLTAPARAAIYGYQHFVSPAKGTTCPMEPSDSAYAKEALRKKGLIGGVLRAADRLHRCGHDVDAYPLVETPRGLKYWDPVE